MTSLASLEPYDRSDCESRHVYVCDGMMFNLSCDKQLELTNFTSFFCQQFYIPCDCKLISYVYTHTHVCTYRGCASNTRGTAFVVYEDIFDAKNACEHLSGFNGSSEGQEFRDIVEKKLSSQDLIEAQEMIKRYLDNGYKDY